jgi:hypothetical protein
VNKAVNNKEAAVAAMVVVNKVAAAMAAVASVDKEMAEIWEAAMVDNKDIENFLCFLFFKCVYFLISYISLSIFELNVQSIFS